MEGNLSYRETVPNNINREDFIEFDINTGTQQLLQDIQTAERSGGYGFKPSDAGVHRNRFIYWRVYHNVLELTEINLDHTLTHNNIRMRFLDTAVLYVNLMEHLDYVTLLVATVSSLHRYDFPLIAKDKGSSNTKSSDYTFSSYNDSQYHSIFYNLHTIDDLNSLSTYHTVESTSTVPQIAAAHISAEGTTTYFALACQSKLTLHIIDGKGSKSNLVSHDIKDHYLMPRFLTNLKGALTGKSDLNNYATSIVFNTIMGEMYLTVLYRNDEIRIWSTITMQTVCSINCIRNNGTEMMQGPQNSMLRKINNRSICVFLSHATCAEFVCLDIVSNRNVGNNARNFALIRRKVIPAPQLDLADFAVSNTCIWGLWNNAEGEYSVSNFALRNGSNMNWTSAALEPLPDRFSLANEQGVDPREAFCSFIFHPGKFDRKVIAKALNMFRKVNHNFDMKQLTMATLKEQVCQAIEDEVQVEIKEFIVNDEEYFEITSRLWERFYSCCEQYHLKYAEPTGLFILDDLDAVCLVRKRQYALLRPCDMLEHIMLAGENLDVNEAVHRYFRNDQQNGSDFINLVMILAQIDKWLPEDLKSDMDRQLYQLEKPSLLVAKLVDKILSGDTQREIMPSNFLVQLRQKLQNIKDIQGAMKTLLNYLNIETEDIPNFNDLSQTMRGLHKNTMFSGDDGLAVLTETVKHSAMIRFALSRNLLILEEILIATFGVSIEVLEAIRTDFMPNTTLYLLSYYIIIWIAETPVKLNTPATLETSMQRLHIAQIDTRMRSYNVYNKRTESTTLLHFFLKTKGLYCALPLLAAKNPIIDEETNLQYTLLCLSSCINQLLWVISFDFTFGSWLFSTCQHVIIQDYVRLLNTWCEWNIYSRQFMLAISMLDCCETHKAYQLFIHSSRGVLKEKFMFQNILKNTPLYELLESKIGPYKYGTDVSVEQTNQALAHYYLKVIQLFEQSHAMNYIIALAQVAIGLLEKNDPQLPMFHSIVFNNHLQLEHYDEAYHSLIYNADTSRRKDCLRQLIVTLFQRKRLDLLMHFPYGGLYDEFENIVESRARSLAMDQNVVYDFLYSFHVNNGNMRKASAVMYEQAMRYQVEYDLPHALQKRCSSLLGCINAMELTDERYRWIAKPLMSDEIVVNISNEDDTIENKIQEVVVLTVADVRREFLLANALLELSKHRKDMHVYINTTAEELCYLLTNSGLYTSALKLVNGYNLKKLSIFESLTAACVRTAQEKANDAWTWLQENDLADLPHRNKAADMAWHLLEKLVNDNEEKNSTDIYKCVVNKLLRLNAFVPQWLHNSYKLKNCPELLYLYVKHNRLLEAYELAAEMIDSMLGSGSEYFSFKYGLSPTNPQLAFPVNTMDLLLHGLQLNSKEMKYNLAYEDLTEKVNTYLNAVSNTTKESLKMAYQQQHANQKF